MSKHFIFIKFVVLYVLLKTFALHEIYIRADVLNDVIAEMNDSQESRNE